MMIAWVSFNRLEKHNDDCMSSCSRLENHFGIHILSAPRRSFTAIFWKQRRRNRFAVENEVRRAEAWPTHVLRSFGCPCLRYWVWSFARYYNTFVFYINNFNNGVASLEIGSSSIGPGVIPATRSRLSNSSSDNGNDLWGVNESVQSTKRTIVLPADSVCQILNTKTSAGYFVFELKTPNAPRRLWMVCELHNLCKLRIIWNVTLGVQCRGV